MANKFQNVQTDRFLGVTIDCSEQDFKSDTDFVDSLKEAIAEWKTAGKRGMWVKIQTAHAALVPALTNIGFDFHHAQPGYVMMTLWMCDNLPNHLPEYANQYIGVGGFVVNSSNQVLVIREKYHDRNQITAWKLPGGHADNGEDLAETARREVLEETGVECEFVSLLAFRHQHDYRFGCSDIYFVCVLRPLTTEINACPVEVADCRWMDLDDYIKDPHVSDANRHFAQLYKEGLESEYNQAILPSLVPSFNGQVLHHVYSIQDSSKSVGTTV